MNRTSIGTRARRRTAATLASTLLVTVALTANVARAQDTTSAPGAAAPPAPPPASPPARPAPVAIEFSNSLTVETKRVPHAITDWQDGEPVPAGYHPVQQVRKGAIIGGAIPFAVLYFISALVAATAQDASNGRDTSSTSPLFVPVVGPFISMTHTSSAVGNMFLLIDGLVQGGGAALVVYGIASPHTILVRDDHYGQLRLTPQPMALGRSGAGFGLTGSF